MQYIHRIFNREEYSNHAFLADQEIELLMDICAYIAGRDLQEGDESRMSRELIEGRIGYYMIYWDGIRKGVMFSGFERNRIPTKDEPLQWLMFYVPDEILISGKIM